jgi:tRNA-specific 2-thiouridylase
MPLEADLGLAPKSRVVVAMSGGVDSSLAAALLAEAGHEVVGVTLQLYDHGQAVARANSCCAGRDIHDARRVADRLGIAHYVLDYERRFEDEVIRPFATAYARGETPSPCIDCNRTVKFRDLLQASRELGAKALVTGHYARSVRGPGGWELHRGMEAARDQSYFLFAMERATLEFLRFPLGGWTKAAVRAEAALRQLPVAAKPDSQDICFIPDGAYAGLVGRLSPEALVPGEIVHVDGRVLGHHQGIGRFTIGQRRGIGLGGGPPLFVTALDAPKRQVVVGPRQALARRHVRLRDLHWLAGEERAGEERAGEGVRAEVKLRSTRLPCPATIRFGENGAADVLLDGPEEGVAPGQACVAYAGERVLGGGWIVEAR